MCLLFNILLVVILAFRFALIGRALFSWFDPTGRTAIGSLLIAVTEPVIAPIRRLMPNTGFLDISFFVVILIVFVLETLLRRTFQGCAPVL